MNTPSKFLAPPLALLGLLLAAGCSRTDESFQNEDSCNICHASSLKSQDVHRIHLSDMAMAAFPLQDARLAKVAGAKAVHKGDTALFLTPDDPSLDSAERERQRRLLAHSYDCGTCHQGTHPRGLRTSPDFHRNGVRDVALDESRLNDSLQRQFQVAGGMTVAAQTCDNVACHGAGRILNPATGAGKQGVIWKASASFGDTLGCNDCHNTTNHKTTIARSNCFLCHNTTTLDGKTIWDYTKHINGVLDVKQ